MIWGAIAQAGAEIAGKVAPYVIDNHWKHRESGMAYDFAQNNIQWRVQDAKKAGIHPLYALGASPMFPNVSFVGGQGGDLDFSSAFSTVTNSKFNKELQKQTLEKNQLEIDGLKLRNQLAYLQSVKPVREKMGQNPISTANTSQIGIEQSSTKNETLSSSPKSIGFVAGTFDGLYSVYKSGSGKFVLKPSQNYSDYASESYLESYRNNMRLNDSDYAREVSVDLTKQFRDRGIISDSEFVVPKYNPLYAEYEYVIENNSSHNSYLFNLDHINRRRFEFDRADRLGYLRRASRLHGPYYGE